MSLPCVPVQIQLRSSECSPEITIRCTSGSRGFEDHTTFARCGRGLPNVVYSNRTPRQRLATVRNVSDAADAELYLIIHTSYSNEAKDNGDRAAANESNTIQLSHRVGSHHTRYHKWQSTQQPNLRICLPYKRTLRLDLAKVSS